MCEATDETVQSRTVVMFALLLVLAGFLAYENSFAGVFHFDDFPCIVTNQSLKSLDATWRATAEEIPGGLRRRDVGRWTFALNRSLHDLDLWGYHAINLAIHLAAGLLLMGLIRRTLALSIIPRTIRNHATWLAFCVALLWVVHPLQTESVTYIVQRLEALMGLFFVACLYALHRGAQGGSSAWYGMSVLSAALSIGTKEVGLMILPVAVMYDRIFLAKDWSELLKRRGWVHGLILAMTLAYFVIGIGKIPYHVKRPDAAGRRATSWEYLRSQPGVLLHYFKLTFWPTDLCLDHVWQVAKDRFEIYGKGSVILGILGIGFALLRRKPTIAFLILTYFIILAPSSTIVPLHLAFEHRVYLSLCTLVCGLVLAVFALTQLSLNRLNRRSEESNSRIAASVTLTLTIALAIPLILATRERNKVYHSQVAMWSDVVRVSPHNARGHMNLAIYAGEQGELDRAENHYQFGLKIDPENDQLHYNYGCLLIKHRNAPEQALHKLRRAVELSGKSALYRFAYADVLERLERFDEAEESFRLGLGLSPKDQIAHLRLGQLLKNQDRFDEAEASLLKASELGPYLWQPHRELGQMDAARGDLDAAIAHYQYAINDPRSYIPEIFEAELAELRKKNSEEDRVP